MIDIKTDQLSLSKRHVATLHRFIAVSNSVKLRLIFLIELDNVRT